MARIRIHDLPEETRISREEMRRVTGGAASYAIFSGLGPSTTDPFDSIDTTDTPASGSGSVPTPYPNTSGTASGGDSTKYIKPGGSVSVSSGDQAG